MDCILKKTVVMRVFLLFLLVCFRAGTVLADAGSDYAIAKNNCRKALEKKDFDRAWREAEAMMAIASAEDDDRLLKLGEIMRLFVSVNRGDKLDYGPEISRVEAALEEMRKNRDEELLLWSYKLLFVYYQNIAVDYPKAIYYSFELLKRAKENHDASLEVSAYINLSSVYFLKGDTSGLQYAMKAYDIAKKLNDEFSIYTSGVNISNYLYNRYEVKEALGHLEEAMGIAKKLDLKAELQYMYSFMGDVYNMMGNPEEAEDYYRKSIVNLPETSTYDKVYSGICYSMFLMQHQRFDEALSQLKRSEKLMTDNDIPTFRKELYANMSGIYEHKGDFENALAYYKMYVEIKDELLSAEREKAFKELDVKYKVSEEKQKNAMQQVLLMEKDKKLQVMIFVAVLALCVSVFVFLLYHHRTKQYKEIVRTNLDKIENEKRLRIQLEKAGKDGKAETKYNTSSLNEEKSKQLFISLEHLMYDERVYHDSGLTLDKLASMLGTNRTYLSRVINEQSGKSYSDYINNYRINEAVEILSDPQNEEQIKTISYNIGFASPQTFYALFKAKIGISPSIYRSNAKKLLYTA